jgi:hypothetical protein
MTTLTDTSTQTLINKYSAEELARALLGALTILQAMRCPHCGYTMEATVESTTEASREQGSGGVDEVER